MQLSEWVRLLSNVPPEVQDGLILGVANGDNVAVQELVRIDPEYVILRGRLGGTTDSGRVFCFPYDQLAFFLFNKQLSEQQLCQIFGGVVKLKRDSLLDEQPEKPALEEEPVVEDQPMETVAEEAPAADAPKAAPDLRARLGLGKAGRRQTNK
jgi:hypothetical protein